MLFEIERQTTCPTCGQPHQRAIAIPRRAVDEAGHQRTADGVTLFTLTDAARESGLSEAELEDLWRSTFEMRMFYEDIGGRAIPRLPFDGAGEPRRADGVTLFDVAAAAQRFNQSKQSLRDLWVSTFGDVVNLDDVEVVA